jgi:hypothetical protein
VDSFHWLTNWKYADVLSSNDEVTFSIREIGKDNNESDKTTVF